MWHTSRPLSQKPIVCSTTSEPGNISDQLFLCVSKDESASWFRLFLRLWLCVKFNSDTNSFVCTVQRKRLKYIINPNVLIHLFQQFCFTKKRREKKENKHRFTPHCMNKFIKVLIKRDRQTKRGRQTEAQMKNQTENNTKRSHAECQRIHIKCINGEWPLSTHSEAFTRLLMAKGQLFRMSQRAEQCTSEALLSFWFYKHIKRLLIEESERRKKKAYREER